MYNISKVFPNLQFSNDLVGRKGVLHWKLNTPAKIFLSYKFNIEYPSNEKHKYECLQDLACNHYGNH